MSFWHQLRRRNVYKVGASYAIVAWIVLQAAGILLPTFGAPDWVLRAVATTLVLGFPAVLVFAWVFEVTPEGIKRTSEVPEERSIRNLTSQRLNYVLGGLLAVAIVFIAVDAIFLDEPGSAAPQSQAMANSIAVLPLENLSPNADNEYVAAGLHEEILNQLAKLRNLSVIARTSVLQYGDERPPLPEIGRALNVQSIMEGSVRYAGNRIRVTTQLVDAATSKNLWSETYDREFDDIFAIESDIAMNVANALRAEFSPDEERSITKEPTTSREAYALFLRSRVSPRDIAHVLLDEAIRFDPRFGLAHGVKARAYAESIINSSGRPAEGEWQEVVGLATSHAEQALAIDPNIGIAHSTLGVVHQRLWRWNQATAAFRRAIELAPNDTQAMQDYAWHAAFSGDYDESVRFAKRQVELSPAAGLAHLNLGLALAYAGETDAAIASYRRTLAIGRSSIASQHVGLLEASKGNFEAAAAEFQTLENLFGGNVQLVFLPELAIGYALIGRDEDATRVANQIVALAEQREIGAGTLAMAYLALGNGDAAAAQLEIAAARVANHEPDQGFFSLMHMKNNWFGHPLLEEPRFRDLRARLHPRD